MIYAYANSIAVWYASVVGVPDEYSISMISPAMTATVFTRSVADNETPANDATSKVGTVFSNTVIVSPLAVAPNRVAYSFCSVPARGVMTREPWCEKGTILSGSLRHASSRAVLPMPMPPNVIIADPLPVEPWAP